MKYPSFFDLIPSIRLQDPLSNFLGTFEEGLVEFTYLDVVKSAGHSCPTVVGAYLATYKALEALYPDSLPQRGQIDVSFKSEALEGVTGVIANVITQITGVTEQFGFKGINGQFIRYNLMHFNADISSEILFKRLDTGKSVAINYNANIVSTNPQQKELMGKIMQGIALPKERKEFGKLWQERVERIFLAREEVIEVKCI